MPQAFNETAPLALIMQQQNTEEPTSAQNLLRGDLANLSFVGSPDCVLPDASGKFFARI
jgi:hypothetical protein